MASQITLESKAAKANKPTIKKDENGYYLINLGAFNTYNSAGEYYLCDNSALEFLKSPKSLLGRRIQNGVLRSEYQHPTYEECKSAGSMEDKLKCITKRAIKIDLDRVCGHIKSVNFNILDKTEKGWENYPIIVINGWVKPAGPFKNVLQEALDNPDENVTFSVRSLVKRSVEGLTIVKRVRDVSTWDYVFEPGIKIASQWNAVGLEHKECDVCLNGMCSTVFQEIMASVEDIDDISVEKIVLENEDDDPLLKW